MKGKTLFLVGVILALMVSLLGPATAAAALPEMVNVLIGFDRQPGPNEQAIVHGAGGTIKYTYGIIPVIAAAVPESAIAGLRANPRVTHVNLDGEVHAIAETLPWGVNRIDAEVVHSAGNKGTGVKVAIIDTGIDKDHPDLAANIKGGRNFVAKPWWATPDPNAWDDDNGHGSHVAGTVAAVDNDIGVIGVAPEAWLYGVKVLDNTGRGYWSDVIGGIDWSVSQGMQVINMSLGASSAPSDLKRASDAAYAAGIIVVAAAGNSGDTDPDDDVGYPAKYESVIAVAATDDTNTRAYFSSDGPATELAAPGVYIPSTWKNGGYNTISGTSMASPHVAGVAALVIKAGIVSNGNGLYGVADEVRARMNATADELGPSGRDTWYGYGLVDADEAAGVSGSPPNNPPVASFTYAGSGLTVNFNDSGSYDSDGTITGYAWNFGDSSTGSGVTVSHTYVSAGTYTVTLTVTDDDGATGSSSQSITLSELVGKMHVGDLDGSKIIKGNSGKWEVRVTVTIHDVSDNPVANATVSGEWSGAKTGTISGTTGSDGTVTFSTGNMSTSNSVTFTVQGVIHMTLTYDATANYDPDSDSNGTAITVTK